MPQISLYIDNDTMQRVEKAAQAEKLSISKWVGNQLQKSLTENYPSDFEQLFGSINDATFQEPQDISFDADAQREVL